MELLEKLLDLLDLHVPVDLTESYSPTALRSDIPFPSLKNCSGNGISPAPLIDLRERIQPKYKGESLLAEFGREQAYYQVFVNRIPGQAGDDGASSFIPNLSILDLLSAEGPDAGRFLL